MIDLFFRFGIWRDWRRYIIESPSGLVVVIRVFAFRYKRTKYYLFSFTEIKTDSLVKSYPILSSCDVTFIHNGRIVETQNHPLNSHKLRARFRSAQIESAFHPFFGWYFKEGVVCASNLLRTRRNDFIGAHNNVKALIADQGSLFTSVLVSNGIESKANIENPNLNLH